MEKTSSNTLLHSFSLEGLLGLFLFNGVLNWFNRIQKSYSQFQCFLLTQLEFISSKSNSRSEKKSINSELLNQKVLCISEKGDDGKLSREDVEMVMGKMRLVCHQKNEKLQDRFGSDELSVLFEDKEPSVEEVKGAFDVFDMNRDGFVDATELQKVLCNLGFREGSKMKDCEKMITTFDENRDGRIDFNEFVKLMENSFCC